MTSLQVIDTGEVVEQLTSVEAERITARIADKLDGIADNIEQVMPLIREALTRKAWIPLGYSGASAYISERFAGAFQRLPTSMRRPIVAELSSAGMSTRAIAPVVGIDRTNVTRDLQVVQSAPPVPAPANVNLETGEILDESEFDEFAHDHEDLYTSEQLPDSDRTPPPAASKVTGIDGKQYPKPESVRPRRRPITDAFFEATYDLGKLVERIERLTEDDRFSRNKNEIAQSRKSDLVRAADTLASILRQLD